MSETYKEMFDNLYKVEPSFHSGTSQDNNLSSERIVKNVRGDGGFTDYYAIPEGTTQLSDLIYHKNMNHSVGEAFCALYRMNDNGEKVRNIRKVIRYMELELQRELLNGAE